MESRAYTSDDFKDIELWGKTWGSNYKESLFPPTGLVVDGIAAYFMYETPSKVCFLENMISNKDVDKDLVRQAADLLLKDMLTLAKSKGYEVAYACTNNTGVIARGIKANATITAGYALIVKQL